MLCTWEPRSPCLLSKCFAHWTTSPAPNLEFYSYVTSSLKYRLLRVYNCFTMRTEFYRITKRYHGNYKQDKAYLPILKFYIIWISLKTGMLTDTERKKNPTRDMKALLKFTVTCQKGPLIIKELLCLTLKSASTFPVPSTVLRQKVLVWGKR